MSHSHENSDKLTPEGRTHNRTEILIWVVIGIQVVLAIGFFPFLPPIVPIHWGIDGQVNGYGSKWVATLLFPGLSLALYFLLRVLQAAGPRLGGRESMRANIHLRGILLAGIILFMLFIQLIADILALGIKADMTMMIGLALSLLYIFLGNYLGKVRRNFWMGIRTPWTITSDLVWERTHRLGGWLFVVCGLLGIPLSFVPYVHFLGTIVPIIFVCVFLYIYSYICYRQNILIKSQPGSQPFDDTNDL